MAKTSAALDTPLRTELDKLAAYEPQNVPVVSLYLNLAADQHGRDNFAPFVRKAFGEHLKAFKENSAERASLERDQDRISKYLAEELNPASQGVAVFASSGGGEFFTAIQVDVPFDEHWFLVASVPQLYPLARLVDQYPRYASVVLDTHRARIFVFSLGAAQRREEVTSEKTRRSAMGGWSQARYQRRADNVHLLHVKEVVDTLDRIVRRDRIQHIIVAGDAVVVPLLKEQLPKHLEEKLVDVLSLDSATQEDRIIAATLEILRRRDAETDGERVHELIEAWQGSNLGVVGPEATLTALQNGQVDELLIAATPNELTSTPLPDDGAPGHVNARTSAAAQPDERKLKLADELVTRALKTDAQVRFIENSELLRDFGGVGALLRFAI